MGSIFDQPMLRQSRTPDQRDHSSLMELYGGGYWNRRREQAKKDEEAKNAKVARPPPTKIRLTQRSPLPASNGSNSASDPINLDQTDHTNGHTHNTSSHEHHAPIDAIAVTPPISSTDALHPSNLVSTNVNGSLHATRSSNAARQSRHRRNAASNVATSTATELNNSQSKEASTLDNGTPATFSTGTQAVANEHAHVPADDDIQIVRTSLNSAPPTESISISDDHDDSQNGVSDVDRLTAANAEAPANSIFKDYKCVVCLDNVTDATATFCGHIFCEACILHAIESNHRCPTCRCKLSAKEIHPLFV